MSRPAPAGLPASVPAIAALAAILLAAAPVDPKPRVTAIVLGVAQDGGLPHLGCVRDCCRAARRDPARARRVASLGLSVTAPDGQRKIFLIDATPDIRSQIDSLLGPGEGAARPQGLPVDGILLTHAHVGHYAGLIYLGRESMASRGVPLYASRRMAAFLSGNGPWRRLVEGRHVDLKELQPDRPVVLAPGLRATPIRVAHREEESDALGFLVEGPARRLLYIPDIDDWGRWDRDLAALVETVDVVLLDGTFYSAGEVPGRSLEEIPHPMIPATMDRLAGLVGAGRRVAFIHLNHTNPARRAGSPELAEIERRKFEIARDGLSFDL
ncbi:MAG TPA: MBL fold metallo-hydrolase [Candidatus Polarisedimenticolia bacterium]|nr:MBL fold metallo-hydrolase [Candidatus Polarisedimenticolia bacterium]